MRHVDLYEAPAFQPFEAVKFLSVLPEENIARANPDSYDLPYWNGYVWYSEPHDWGECRQHRPRKRDG